MLIAFAHDHYEDKFRGGLAADARSAASRLLLPLPLDTWPQILVASHSSLALDVAPLAEQQPNQLTHSPSLLCSLPLSLSLLACLPIRA